MYPEFKIFDFTVYTFGISLSISFILFFWMLYKLSLKFGINTNFFLNNILFYLISISLFSRLFYVLAEWRNFKYVFGQGARQFFLMADYNLSLIGGIVGFMLVLFFKIKRYKLKSEKYLDAAVLSFLFAGIVCYIGAFLGGQVYGKPTALPIGITLGDSATYSGPTFPLAIVYSILCFLIFTGLYMTRLFVKIEGFVGYLGVIIFSCCLLIFEYFNGAIDDSVSSYLHFLNMTQLGAICLIIYGAKGFSKIYRQEHST